jgi:hypothetical protein
MNKSILVFAPGHSENDRRVNRTVELFADKFQKVFLIYESRFSSKGKNYFPSNVEVIYIEETRPIFKVIPKLYPYINIINKYKLPIENICIHDSGLFGIILAKKLRNDLGVNPKIILDYHDYVPWEIHYQVKKIISNELLNKVIGNFLLSFFSLYLRSEKLNIFDGVVGISEPQVKSLLNWLRYPNTLNYISIPNTRKKIKIDSTIINYPNDYANFLWIGNIVDGRDLPITLDYLDRLYKIKIFKLYIFGSIVSHDVFELLSGKPYFIYMGAFKDDTDIISLCQKKKIIALFFGWKDNFQIGINEISSPNKMFSYINLGVPTLFNSSVNPTLFDGDYKIGKSFVDFESFKISYETISENYDYYIKLLSNSRDNFIWESDLKLSLSYFYENIFD